MHFHQKCWLHRQNFGRIMLPFGVNFETWTPRSCLYFTQHELKTILMFEKNLWDTETEACTYWYKCMTKPVLLLGIDRRVQCPDATRGTLKIVLTFFLATTQNAFFWPKCLFLDILRFVALLKSLQKHYGMLYGFCRSWLIIWVKS
jgi:hypothetical protein